MPLNRHFHTWTEDDRQILCLLNKLYRHKYISTIFNHILSTRLKKEGFRCGMTVTSLNSQYQEIKRGGNGHQAYARIDSLSEGDIRNTYRNQVQKIESAVRYLKISIQPKPGRSGLSLSSRATKPRRTNLQRPLSIPATDSSSNPPAPVSDGGLARLRSYTYYPSHYFETSDQMAVGSEDVPAQSLPKSPAKVIPALRISTDPWGNPAQSHPLLLFRATPNINSFRSRRYPVPNDRPPTPPGHLTREYRDIVRPHLERDRKYKSPFVSFAQNPRNAIRRIETAKSEDFDNKMFLAIFSFNDIAGNSTQNFGPGSGPHLVRSIYSGQEISELPDGYNGCGEWLSYGYIGCEPLAILDASQAIALAKALRRFKHGQTEALLEISKHLQVVPVHWREAVAYVILRYYSARSLPKRGSQAYTRMMDTVVNGRANASTTLINFLRLSVDDSDPDYLENLDHDAESPPTDDSHEIESIVVELLQASDPLSRQADPLSATETAANAAVRNLNSLAATDSRPRVTQQAQSRVPELTPFWSPSPFDDTNIPDDQPAEEATEQTYEEADESEDSWDLINEDMEADFAEAYPSAAKKGHNLQPSSSIPQPQDEGDWHVVPSIESSSGAQTDSRYEFLFGIRDHAISPSTPLTETPSKAPSQNRLPTSNKNNSFNTLTKPTSSGCHNKTSENVPPMIDLTKEKEKPSASTFTFRSPLSRNENPRTNVRTKVPVIVRKRLLTEGI